MFTPNLNDAKMHNVNIFATSTTKKLDRHLKVNIAFFQGSLLLRTLIFVLLLFLFVSTIRILSSIVQGQFDYFKLIFKMLITFTYYPYIKSTFQHVCLYLIIFVKIAVFLKPN